MDAATIVDLLVPAALGLIMFALGLGLSTADFARVATYPRAVAIGLATQMILLTAIAYVVARVFALPPVLATGLMLVAASPGGAAACLYSHLARGDVALNLTLAGLNSVLALVWLPFIVAWSMQTFFGAARPMPAPTHEVLRVIAIVGLPVLAGMVVRRLAPEWCRRAEQPTRWLAVAGLVVLVASVYAEISDAFLGYVVQAGPAAIAFNVVSLGLGYTVPRLAGLPRFQAKAIALEIGLHNAALAIYFGLSVLGDSAFAIVPVVYGVVMFATGAVFAAWLARKD